MSVLCQSLYCLETQEQVQRVLPEFKALGQSAAVLALTPQADYALERLGITTRRPEDYYAEEDVHHLGSAQLAVVNEMSQLIDEVITSEVDAFRSRNLLAGSLFWYDLKNLLNSVAVRVFILERVLRAERPEAVVYFDTCAEPLALTLEFAEESIWARVIPVVCNALDIPCRVAGTDETSQEQLKFSADLTKVGLTRDYLKSLLLHIGARQALYAARSTRSRFSALKQSLNGRVKNGQWARAPVVAMLSTGYSLSHVVNVVSETGELKIFYFNVRAPWEMQQLVPRLATISLGPPPIPQDIDAELSNAWHVIGGSGELHELLTVSGVQYLEIVKPRLRYLLSNVTVDILRTYLQTEAMIKQLKPSVLVGTTVHYPEKVAFLAAQASGVPTVVYRHGASAAFVSMETAPPVVHHQNDFRWSDFVLTFGDGDTCFYQKYYSSGGRPISVGSAVLDELRHRRRSSNQKATALRRLGLDTGRPTVMYVPTSMDGNTRPIPYRGRSPSLMFQMERAIADVFGEFPDVQCIFKLHRAGIVSPIVRYIEDKGYANCRVFTLDFVQVLHLADVFVVDYPTTTFLEMLTTDRPILLCGYHLPHPFNPTKWHPSILPMWQERVQYAEDLESFLDMLRAFLREGKFEAVQSSDEMLRLFGTHLDDGRSAERAVAAIKQMACSPSRRERSVLLPS